MCSCVFNPAAVLNGDPMSRHTNDRFRSDEWSNALWFINSIAFIALGILALNGKILISHAGATSLITLGSLSLFVFCISGCIALKYGCMWKIANKLGENK